MTQGFAQKWVDASLEVNDYFQEARIRPYYPMCIWGMGLGVGQVPGSNDN